ncbi:PREDICTED: protein bric-a-brac 1-like isoform X1 [Nicrophorus vespilloides]|uniref:Protein bric-a-brac 1-like isoform X1 n=1 Tax=Nicrophorus vespilloides TaxID=110193 RepID=A0ABM1MW95_NICVS|nr:PREDICTED: protein bric-a-brac 1-like isoform X1 [Nicrophorus vespilloides]
MDSQQFSLCWDNFHVNMSSGMHSLLEKEDLVDVTLAIEGQYLKAHKMVLSVCSPYFRKLFSTNPCKHPIFFMKDVTYEVMNDLLTFMYQGEVQVNQENLATFIKTAEALQIKGLTGENREVDDALKEVNSLKRPPPFPDEPRNRLNRSKPISAKKIKTTQETQDLQRDESYIEQTSDSMQLKVEPNEQVEDAESYGWPDDSYLNETENLPDDSQVDEAEECHMMEEEPKPGTSLEGAIPNQDFARRTKKTRKNVYRGRRKPEMPRYIVDGFVFHVNIIKGSPPMTYLRCLEYKRLGCLARAVIPHNGTINDIKIKKEHNHPPDYAAEEKIVFLRELKDMMLSNESISPKEIYEHLSPLYPNAARETSYLSIKAKMNRWRRINDGENMDLKNIICEDNTNENDNEAEEAAQNLENNDDLK